MHRVTDQADSRFFQSDRFFTSDGLWYFTTREGVEFGPFTVKSDGEKALQRYLETQRTMRRLRARDPALDEERQWNDRSVARAAREVADWRLDRGQRSDNLYSDRSGKHK